MKRPFYAFFIILYEIIVSTFINLNNHRLGPAYLVAIFLLFLGILFFFVSYMQTISPFVYPLF